MPITLHDNTIRAASFLSCGSRLGIPIAACPRWCSQQPAVNLQEKTDEDLCRLVVGNGACNAQDQDNTDILNTHHVPQRPRSLTGGYLGLNHTVASLVVGTDAKSDEYGVAVGGAGRGMTLAVIGIEFMCMICITFI